MRRGRRRTARKDEVPHLRRRVEDAHLDVVADVDAEFLQHTARIGDRPRAVRQALVPRGRRPEQSARIARAERADDQVVHAFGVLDGDEDGRGAGAQADLDRRRARVR